jgi:lipopolysaccharide/colanic/teichoic acid biosynthesis glycosyltransferase
MPVASAGIARDLPPIRPGLPRWVEAPVALVGLAIASPLLALAALLVAATSRGPVLFRQQRMGREGRPFTLLKFRSMRHDSAGSLLTSRADRRVTAVGAGLRRTKLDELPQLWNVVRGDMSLVGPRPEVVGYVDLADPRWRRVLEARPGITDPLTLKLRDEEALMPAAEADRERFYLETLQPIKLGGYLEYLSTRSAARDLGVLFATVTSLWHPGRGPTREEILRTGRL